MPTWLKEMKWSGDGEGSALEGKSDMGLDSDYATGGASVEDSSSHVTKARPEAHACREKDGAPGLIEHLPNLINHLSEVV